MNRDPSSSSLDAAFQQAVACHQSGRLYDALENYQRVIAQLRQYVEAFLNAATLLERFGQLNEALEHLDAAVALQPAIPDSHCLRGNLLFRLQRHADALASYDRALALRPDFPEALLNRGLLLAHLRRFDEALASYARASEVRPDYLGAYINRGQLLKELERFDEALACYEQALKIDSNAVDVLNNRGIVLVELRQPEAALASYQRALALKPDHVEAHVNLGILQAELGRVDEALTSYERAIAIRPDFATAHSNRAILLKELHRLDEALVSIERATRARPDFAEAHYIHAELLLLAGKYVPGWTAFEWRWKSRYRDADVSPPAEQRWTGAQPLAGKCLLIVPEVGYGDQIMFARYARLIEEQGAEVLVRAAAPLRELFFSLGDTITVIDEGDETPPFDYWCPIMSLPQALGTTLQSVPAELPYLAAPPARRTLWHERLGAAHRPRIGLVWAGSADRQQERNPRTARSMPLASLAPLLRLPFEFHVLQREIPAGDAATLESFPDLIRHGEDLHDFADTAALIEEMDLIISVDTAVAHLAGALGKRLWVMLPWATDYRWTDHDETTPWYPAANLFRQGRAGDWDGVVERVGRALSEAFVASEG